MCALCWSYCRLLTGTPSGNVKMLQSANEARNVTTATPVIILITIATTTTTTNNNNNNNKTRPTCITMSTVAQLVFVRDLRFPL